jgi:hypothetical protein
MPPKSLESDNGLAGCKRAVLLALLAEAPSHEKELLEKRLLE